jgi:hypothetical protein
MRWRLVEIASSMLKPDERDAVLGDFAESGETGGQALRGVLSLVLRRQAALWKEWRPWLVLVGVLIPLAWLLSIAAKLTAGGSAVYLWFYLNNWDWTLLRYVSFWYFLRDAAIAVSVQYAILICWAWSAGFLLGSVSRRIAPTNFLLFCLISVLGEVLLVSRYLRHWFRPAQSDPVSALLVYRELFPVLVLLVLVVIPVVWAIHRGARLRRLPKFGRISLLVIATLAIVGMAIRQPGLGFSVNAHKQLAFLHGWPTRALQLIVYWPVVYLLVSTIMRRWQKESTT